LKKSRKVILLPTMEKILQIMGENIKLARKRRRLSLQQVSERAGIARSTLGLIEMGNSGVSMGGYAQVLFVLNQEKDLLKIATDDLLGRKLQDIGLLGGGKKTKKRAQSR
jgi:transcriptional regulator with XRE-family HTH domain